MKVRYDDTEIELTDRVIESLKEHMKATVAMMREADPDSADCWTWGRCEVVNFSWAGGIEFTYGSDEDWPDEQSEQFEVVAAPRTNA